jgi:nitrite reductase/ring-hydroxylating ferredoxin subunit
MITRRHVLGGATAAGVAGPLLSACGGGSESQPSSTSPSAESGPTIRCACHGSIFSAVDGSVLGGPAPSALAPESVAVQGDEIEVDGSVVGPKSDVPEGGGVVFRDQKVVVTQPEPGEFKAFTAVCTHQGCLVDSVEPA